MVLWSRGRDRGEKHVESCLTNVVEQTLGTALWNLKDFQLHYVNPLSIPEIHLSTLQIIARDAGFLGFSWFLLISLGACRDVGHSSADIPGDFALLKPPALRNQCFGAF